MACIVNGVRCLPTLKGEPASGSPARGRLPHEPRHYLLGREQAGIWHELYNAEESWLDWALKQAGLPPCDQIFSA